MSINLPQNVFINCPFDKNYKRFFEAAVFTVTDCGFVPRCALEVEDASEVRIDKICRIVAECRYSIHDLSRTEVDPSSKLPRFNMPLELGLFLGAKRFGGAVHAKKNCMILDVERYRYQKFISDIAGQDIREHEGKVDLLIKAIRDWLNSASRRKNIPGPAFIAQRFESFEKALPELCKKIHLKVAEMHFTDFQAMAATWLDEHAIEARRTVGPRRRR